MAGSDKFPAPKASSRKRAGSTRKTPSGKPVTAPKSETIAAKAEPVAVVTPPAKVPPIQPQVVEAKVAPVAVTKPTLPIKSTATIVDAPAPVAAVAAETPAEAAKAPADLAETLIEIVKEPAEKAKTIVTNIVEASDEKIFQKGMAKMTNTTENFAAQAKVAAETAATKVQALANDVTAKAKAFGEKGLKALNESGEFTKANAEAVVASGKIAGKGFQDLGQSNIEFAKKAIEETSAAMKKFAAIKSPTEFFQLQGELIRKNLDDAVAQGSKNVEAVLNLSNEVFQPISSRFAVVADKIKTAA